MALEHADEALCLLVDALASRPGSVQDRLTHAWFSHGAGLRPEDLPEDNREDLQFIQEAMAAGAEALTDKEAAEVASTIARMRGEAALAYGRQLERESRLGRWKRTRVSTRRREA